MQVVAILVVVAIGIAIAYAGWLAAKRRREAMAALAAELGWRFAPGKDRGHDDQFAHFEIFRRGHGRAAYNTIVGEMTLLGASCPVRMGDFVYKVSRGSGKSRRTEVRRFSYLIAELPFRELPDLLIRREGIFDKIAGAFGFDDIDFESAEFSRRFYVRSPDKRFAYDVVHPRMMEFLLETGPPCVDMERGRCCISDGRSRWEPQWFKGWLTWIDGFYARWPEHLLAALR